MVVGVGMSIYLFSDLDVQKKKYVALTNWPASSMDTKLPYSVVQYKQPLRSASVSLVRHSSWRSVTNSRKSARAALYLCRFSKGIAFQSHLLEYETCSSLYLCRARRPKAVLRKGGYVLTPWLLFFFFVHVCCLGGRRRRLTGACCSSTRRTAW